jgi:hypothetical protein
MRDSQARHHHQGSSEVRITVKGQVGFVFIKELKLRLATITEDRQNSEVKLIGIQEIQKLPSSGSQSITKCRQN